MNSFTIKHVLLWGNIMDTYVGHDEDSINCINALIIVSSTDELNIWVNENFDLLPILDKCGIVHLKLMLDEMLFMS